jgi:basic membrane protein A
MYDITNGGVDIAPTKDLLTDDVIAAVEAAKADLQSGAVVVSTDAAQCPTFTLAN